MTNLLELNIDIVKSLDGGNAVDIIYTDIRKAYDSVNHSILIRKLSDFSFSSGISRRIYSYLINRENIVCFLGRYSQKFRNNIGVPQGSSLSSCLFDIFCNDISDDINSSMLLFADDLKIYRDITDINDCNNLQDDLNNINNWMIRNNMEFNTDKCR